MNKILMLLLLAIATRASAQIKTIVTEPITISKNTYYSSEIEHSFAFGDSVTIHAYKKKSNKYHFLVETDDYANVISCNNIPFEATEKMMKKLPNALSDEARVLRQKLQNDVENRKRETQKKKAFAGEVWATVSSSYSFTPVSGTDYKLKNGDVVYIVGYKGETTNYQYALYSTNFAGIYRTTSNKYIFSKDIDTRYLPSIDDPDVQQFLAEKQREIIQREAEAKILYRGKALRGEVMGVLSYGTPEPIESHASNYESGDTVRVVGYSKVDDMNYYALYSDYNYGTFKSSRARTSTFKNDSEIDFDRLPAYDDPEVKLVLKQQGVIIDSVMQVRLAESQRRLEEVTANLIQAYKENQPFIIHDIDWDSDSAGGIELSVSITNCTQQTIKYVTFNGYFKNAVGDKCRNEIGGGTVWTAKGIGPIGPCPSSFENSSERINDCEGRYNFDNHRFYSRVAETFKLSSVTVQYMNGKTVTLSGANLDKHVRY